jgi:type II secretory pathway component PulJ
VKPTRQLQRGETLTGMLVGVALGLLVLAAGAHMLAQLLRGHRLALQDSHLQQDLHFALDTLGYELQDAQYSAKAWSSRSPAGCNDAFCDGPEDFSLGSARIDWSLDRNHNGVQDNDECTGLRLRSGTLQVRTACSPEVWTALTDTGSLTVTQLQASLQCEPRSGWLHRQVLLQVQAQWPGDATRALTLSRTVDLRNPLPLAVQSRYCP